MFIDFAKQFLRPTSPLVLSLGLIAAALWIGLRPNSRGARRFLFLFVAAYLFLATPFGAGMLVAGLSRGLQPIQSAEAVHGADAVVVLSGGAQSFESGGAVVGALTQGSILRCLEAARVYRTVGARTVFASGGAVQKGIDLKPESELMRDVMIAAGVPAERIVQENGSRTTREQARAMKPMLAARGIRQFVLVTSPTHMRRALAVFRAEGLDPVPSISRLRSEHVPDPPLWLPSEEALYFSDMALYDYAAWVYYAVGGAFGR